MVRYGLRERTIGRILEDKAALNGERPYLFFEERAYSYADMEVLSNRIANSLKSLGIRHGSHVAVMMDNKPEIVWAYFALGKLGAVAVPINTAAKGELLAYYLNQSDSEAVIVEMPLVERLLAVKDNVPKIRQAIVYNEAGELPRELPRLFRVPVHDYLALEQGPTHSPGMEVKYSDLHYILYTSGTTGPSKGNMSTHCHALTCGFELVEAFGYRPDDILYVCLPLFHGNALLCSCLPALVADAAMALARRFSASTFWDDIRKFGVTQFNSLGAMTNFLWSRPPDPRDADNPIRQCMVVPTPKEFYHAFEQRFGLKFTSVYALTDCGMVTIHRPDDPPEKWASAGRVSPKVEVRIVDDEDFELPPGEVGEIVVRGREPWVLAQGYYDLPEANVRASRNLWFHTGDRGYVDADGFLYFVDRKKDAIRRRGENISSYEVEQIILKHPAVLEVAAFPVTSEHSEDEVMVSVVLREGAMLKAEELVEFCQENMAYFMVPRYVEFVSALPKTMTEKVEKYKLCESAQKRLPAIWDRERAGIKLKR